MKLIATLLFSAVAALAQIPAHSEAGPLTIDTVDVSIPVPYGPSESRAVISICTKAEFTNTFLVTVYYSDSNGNAEGVLSSIPVTKIDDSNFCGTLVATSDSKQIAFLEVQEVRTTKFFPPGSKFAPTPAASTAKVRQ